MTVKEEAEKYFNAAAERFINKDYEGAKNYFTKAIEDLTSAIESDQNNRIFYGYRGYSYINIGDYVKAIEDFTKAIEIGPDDKAIYENRGLAYFNIENYAKAIDDFTKAIEISPEDKAIYENRGLAYFNIQNYPKAIEDLTTAIESDQNNGIFYGYRGYSYINIGDYAKAIEDLTKAIDLGENDKDIYENRGLAYFNIENYAKAIDDFTKAIDLGSNNGIIYKNRGLAYFNIQNYLKVIEDLTTAIELGENDKSIYGIRGIAYLYRKEFAKAIEDLTTAIKLGVNVELIYVGRGLAYLCIDDYLKAVEDFSKVIQSEKNKKNVYRIRGIAYVGAKDYQKAIGDFKKVIKLNKGGKEKENNTVDSDNILNTIPLTENIFDLVTDILQKNEIKVLPDDETLNLIELVCSCYDLMDEIKIKFSEIGKQFVHYTKAGTLQFLLKKDHSAKLRLNNAVYMNDPEEGQILKRVLCQLDKNNELEKLFKDEDVKNYTYLTCFCPYDKRDELPMWVHYGDGGKGAGLVFNSRFFDKTDLYSVIYIDVKNPDIKKLNQNLQDKITAILNLLKKGDIKNNDHKEFKFYVNIILNYVSYLFKDKAYEYENEVRILNYRDYASEDINTVVSESGIPRLFTEYDECISNENCIEVIAGPKASYTEIAAYAKYVGIQKVSQSEIKYR